MAGKKILFLGNSFALDGLHQLNDMLDPNDDYYLSLLYVSGGSLENHIDRINNGKYTLHHWDKNGYKIGSQVTFAEVVDNTTWDNIIINQVSGKAGIKSSYDKNLNTLIDLVNTYIDYDVDFGLYMPWAYASNSSHSNFDNYDNNQLTMYNMIASTQKSVLNENNNIKEVIPCGTMIQKSRETELNNIGNEMTRDTFHLDLEKGRYVLSLFLYQYLTGNKISDFSDKLTSSELTSVINSANHTIDNPFTLEAPEPEPEPDPEPEPEPEQPEITPDPEPVPRKTKTTEFVFFYDTPFTDYQNTVHFSSNSERDDYFLNGRHFKAFNYSNTPFNFIRDRSKLKLYMSWEDAQGINYCTFLSGFENRRYYAFVNAIEFLNDNVIEMTLVIDTVMTYTQGNVLERLPNVNVIRQHLPRSEYMRMLPNLRNNDDILKVSNKYYTANFLEQFGNNYVVFQSSADLSKEFGTKKEPNLDTSKGLTYDFITSPVNLYVMTNGDFNNFMDSMSKYPWITQNFQKIQMIPEKFINSADLVDVSTDEDITGLMTLKSGSTSNQWTLDNLSLSFNQLQSYLGVTEDELQHLVRNEYVTVELYSWNGDVMLIDAGKIQKSTGLEFRTKSIIGYHNEVRVYPADYNSGVGEQPIRSTNGNVLIDTGSYLNTNITFSSFAEVPILIDNGVLQQAQQANRVKNAEDKLITNRAKNIASGSDPKSKFYDTASIISNISPTQLFSKFNDEYDFYRDQKAEYKDLALQPPSTTSSEMGNAFQIANSINGLTMKIGVPAPVDVETLAKYYKMFGYELNDPNTTISPIDSMTVCNYLQISGTYTINGIDPTLMGMLKSLLEGGVRFWHNNGTNNPMNRNIQANKFR